MNLAQLISTYLNLNFLVIIGFISLGILSVLMRFFKLDLNSRTELKLHYIIMTTILAFAVIHPFLPKHQFFSPAAKIWAAPSLKSFNSDTNLNHGTGYLSLPGASGISNVPADHIANTWIALAIFILLLGFFMIRRELKLIFQIRKKSYLIRKVGGVRILASETALIPFSYWLPGQANIVIPSDLLMRPQDFKLVVAHELQHHRHADTRWVYILWGMKLICPMNPAIYFWNHWITEIQEFACDETLVDRKKVESQAYARCLFEVAQTAFNRKDLPVCATGLVSLVEGNLLKRRIKKMLSTSTKKNGRFLAIAFGLTTALVLGTAAFASRGLVQDRRVTLVQAKLMAERAQSAAGFPIAVNEAVVKQLNRYIGTPEGREFMHLSLTRMENYKSMVAEHLEKYHVPAEIMAIPIVESGYQNLSQGQVNPSNISAGLWQFIPSTARIYGLQVDAFKDERLDVQILTDAAMRYLQSNNLRFKDWQLAILGYNMGEGAVQKAMTKLGTKDAWTLIENGYEGDKDYLAKVMAAILIMQNPESVQ